MRVTLGIGDFTLNVVGSHHRTFELVNFVIRLKFLKDYSTCYVENRFLLANKDSS